MFLYFPGSFILYHLFNYTVSDWNWKLKREERGNRKLVIIFPLFGKTYITFWKFLFFYYNKPFCGFSLKSRCYDFPRKSSIFERSIIVSDVPAWCFFECKNKNERFWNNKSHFLDNYGLKKKLHSSDFLITSGKTLSL